MSGKNGNPEILHVNRGPHWKIHVALTFLFGSPQYDLSLLMGQSPPHFFFSNYIYRLQKHVPIWLKLVNEAALQ
ncbi:MAG: hypothetical protein Ct9H300mP27_06600 [Chloroflexota bacterium]|nr:MAG: hypothetical protein Ct9H300mP27_06600 [Chloroflexota bacterium]